MREVPPPVAQAVPPLWRVLRQAHAEDTGTIQYSNGTPPVLGEPDHLTWAAEIRALRDWLVPEEDAHEALFPSLPADTLDHALAAQRGQRQALRALLTTEAERAEKGE